MSESKRGRPRSQTSHSVEVGVKGAAPLSDTLSPVDPWDNEIYSTKPSEEIIKEVIKDFDVSKLADNQKNYIGMCAGFKMWDILSENDKRQAWINGTAKNYHSHSIYTPAGVPPLLCYKRVGKGFKNEYIINLNTMRPTKSSTIQEAVPESIIKYFLDKV